MKTFLKSIFVICLCIAIFVFSGVRLKYIDQDVRNKNYNSMAVRKIFNEVNEESEVTLDETPDKEANTTEDENAVVVLNVNEPTKVRQQDWRLVLVNHEHALPDNFKIELANIDRTRQFDKRAIDELNALLLAAKQAKVGDLWAQSAYRSVERQEELFTNKVNEYKEDV